MEKLDLGVPNIWKMGEVSGRANGRRRHRAGTATSPVNNEWGKRESGQKKKIRPDFDRSVKIGHSKLRPTLTDRPKSGRNFFLTDFRSN